MTVAVNFIGEHAETFTVQLSVLSKDQGVINTSGIEINCTNSDQEIVLNHSTTNMSTTLKLDLNETVTCCLSVPTGSTKCDTYTPKITYTEGGYSSNSAAQDNTLLAVVGGLGGTLVLLLLLTTVIIATVLVCKAIKSNNSRLHCEPSRYVKARFKV